MLGELAVVLFHDSLDLISELLSYLGPYCQLMQRRHDHGCCREDGDSDELELDFRQDIVRLVPTSAQSQSYKEIGDDLPNFFSSASGVGEGPFLDADFRDLPFWGLLYHPGDHVVGDLLSSAERLLPFLDCRQDHGPHFSKNALELFHYKRRRSALKQKAQIRDF